MQNQLKFSTLQHLYAMLSMVDVRTISDIRKLSNIFQTLQPAVEKLEDEQNVLREKAMPHIARMKEAQAKDPDAVHKESAVSLGDLDKQLQELQEMVDDTFEFSKDQVTAIQEYITDVIKTNGTQHELLKGRRRLECMFEICEFFQIKENTL